MTSLTFAGTKITRIGNRAFAGCGSLGAIKIPTGVGEIGEGAFANCGKLNSSFDDSTIPQLGEKVFGDTLSDSMTINILGGFIVGYMNQWSPQLLSEYAPNGTPEEINKL